VSAGNEVLSSRVAIGRSDYYGIGVVAMKQGRWGYWMLRRDAVLMRARSLLIAAAALVPRSRVPAEAARIPDIASRGHRGNQLSDTASSSASRARRRVSSRC